MKKYLLLTLALGLNACSKQDIKSVDYYAKHLPEAKKLDKACKKHHEYQDLNCLNAQRAIQDENYKLLWGPGIPIESQ